MRPRRRLRRTDRNGFIMFAALGITVVLSALGLRLGIAARTAVASSAQRAEQTRLRWAAEGCAAMLLAEIDVELGRRRDTTGPDPWLALDRLEFDPAVSGLGCERFLVPAGTTVDINAADSATVHRVLVASGLRAVATPPLVDAILDWRDADSVARPSGAEQKWYDSAGRPRPTNRPLEHAAELFLVRGFDTLPDVRALFGTSTHPIVLSHAPRAVLASVPELVGVLDAIESVRRENAAADWLALTPSLDQVTAAAIEGARPELDTRTTWVPSAWWLTVVASAGEPGPEAGVSLRLVRGTGGVHVAEHRTLVR